MSSTRSGIFICYSRRDAKALDQLRPFLRPLQRRGLIDFWDDTSLEAGDDWAAGDADAPAVAGLPAAFREAGHRPDVAWLDTRGASAPLLAEVPLVVRRRLREQLRADDNEPVPHLLRRWAPTVVGSGKRAIVWLDWGTFGDGHGEPLKSVDLEAWLSFSSEFLGLHCPHDVRLVSYLAIETPASKHKRLAEVLQQHRRQPWCRRPEFRLSVLPPLGKVAEEDLFDFLEDPQSSSCDPAIHAEVAERLIAETGGEFEPTVALMREAEEGSWYDLLTRLRRSQGELEKGRRRAVGAPLLLTGEPGTGKTQVAFYLAWFFDVRHVPSPRPRRSAGRVARRRAASGRGRGRTAAAGLRAAARFHGRGGRPAPEVAAARRRRQVARGAGRLRAGRRRVAGAR